MYEPKKYWDEIGKASKAGKHGSGRFGTNNDGNSLYEIPPLESPPKFFEYMEKESNVLDIGSGVGFQVGKLILKGVNAVGCDISKELIDVAKSNCKNLGVKSYSFKYWDGHELPFDDDKFQCVTTNTVLQHVIEEAQIKDIFKEVKRVLKQDGLFCISELVAPKGFQATPHVILRSVKGYRELGQQNNLMLFKVNYFPRTYGSIVYYIKKIIPQKPSLPKIVKISNKVKKIKIIPSKRTKLIKLLLMHFSNIVLNKLVVMFKAEKIFTAQAEMIFIKKSSVTN